MPLHVFAQSEVENVAQRYITLLVWCAFTASALAHTAPALSLGDKAILVSREAFLRDLRLDKPELAAVKAALDKGTLDAAGRAYITHFRTKPIKSCLWTDWSKIKRNPRYRNKWVEGLFAGHFWDGYNVYDAPPSGIDWRNCPLVCITRFPIFGPLRYAIYHTQNPKYARFLVNHILEYMRAYPIEEFIGKGTQGFKGDYTVIRPWHWCMMPQRIEQVARSMPLIRAFPQITDDELLAILHRVYQETIYVRLHMKKWVDKRHNGGLGMIQGMAHACKLFEDFKAADEWSAYNARMLTQYINQSFYPDGQCVEMTVAYSAAVVEETQQLAYLIQDAPGIQAAAAKLRAMTDWCVGLRKPSGRLPAFGDLYPIPARRAVYRPILDWLDVPYARTILFHEKGPLPPYADYPVLDRPAWAGYYVMRSDWTPQARYLCIDAGPWGISHAHGDKLSFVLSAYRADFIIDPTSTKYRNNQPDSLISTQQAGFLHNTITVDGVDEFMNEPREVKKPLTNAWRHGPRYTLFEGAYSFKPVKPVAWERRVVFAGKSYWLLQDVLTGEQDAAAVEQNFQFEKGTKIEFIKGDTTLATAPNGARLLLTPLPHLLRPVLSIGDETPHTTYWPHGKPHPNRGVKGGKENVPLGRGWTGRGGRKLLPAPAVTYVGRIQLPAVITLAIIPLAPGSALASAPKVTFEADGDKTLWRLPLDPGALEVTTTAGMVHIVSVGR